MTHAEFEATENDDVGRYLAVVAARLEEDGVESKRAQRAINHLEHGLGGERSPIAHYGPPDDLAKAVVEVFSVRRWRPWRLLPVFVSCSLIVVFAASMALSDVGTPTRVVVDEVPLPFGPNDRVLRASPLGIMAFLPAMAYVTHGSYGYLLFAKAGRYTSRSFDPRPVRTSTILRFLGAMLAMAVPFPVVSWLAPPNYDNAYLISSSTLWIAIAVSVVVGLASAAAHVRHSQVPIAGDAKYLLRDTDDMLRNVPGRWLPYGPPY